ncbi:MAG: hypothetical protein LBD72_00805, partial [Puniceicoccales bacterium]|nr:hypothetical protein [Puniceicoccales bacterium]
MLNAYGKSVDSNPRGVTSCDTGNASLGFGAVLTKVIPCFCGDDYTSLVETGNTLPGFGSAQRKDFALVIMSIVFFPIGLIYISVRFIYCCHKGIPVTIFWLCMRSVVESAKQTPVPQSDPPQQSGHNSKQEHKTESDSEQNSNSERSSNLKPEPEPEPGPDPELELELEPTKKPAEELPKGLTEELTEEPGPPQDIPSRKD